MTNSLAIFQTIMNKILRNMINKGKVVAFVDNVLVETETEKEHNKIVKEILKKLEENNLYVKLEKCMWKVRKIRFLGVVIRPNRIEMEKKKVNRVPSWPEPKNIKNARKFLGLTNYYRRHKTKRVSQVYQDLTSCRISRNRQIPLYIPDVEVPTHIQQVGDIDNLI